MINFFKKWKYGLGFLLFLVVMAYVINEQGNQADRTEAVVTDFLYEDVEDEYDTCLARVDVRRTLNGILDAVADGTITSRTALNLIDVAGFESLDPGVRAYLENLEASLNSPSEDSLAMSILRDNFKENNPIPDCDEERRLRVIDLEKELDDS